MDRAEARIDGECEVPGKRCVWAVAYERLKPYGEALTMLEREPVIQDNALRGTSAWANTYLGRDHYGRQAGGQELVTAAGRRRPRSSSSARTSTAVVSSSARVLAAASPPMAGPACASPDEGGEEAWMPLPASILDSTEYTGSGRIKHVMAAVRVGLAGGAGR